MKKFSLFLLLCLFLVHCSSTEPTTEEVKLPVPEIKETYLYYIGDRGQGFDIYRWNSATRKEEQVTDGLGWEWQPIPVPEKNYLIYNSTDTVGNFQRRAMRPDGTPLDIDLPPIDDFIPNPQGEKLVWQKKDEVDAQLWVASMENLSDSMPITEMKGYNGRPKWSPDGNQILFIGDQSGSNELYLYDLPSAKTRRITDNELREKYTSWTKDGKSIVTTMAEEEMPNDIYRIDLATLEVTQLTKTSINESEISMDPQGCYVSYHAQLDGRDDIFLLELETKDVLQITSKGYHGETVWMEAKE